ncbi:MAG: hypothetical protein JST06_01140 [Bacteroidetes bacterium]|nr:hypothetical protein [Bacteroidota bacterium]MBS1629558.1 hypothetical protein [Bacteroidota bacterium]
MPQQIKIDITVNGQKITPFNKLLLRQQFNEHHSFELHFNHEVLEEEGALSIDKSKNFLGKVINITFGELNGAGTKQTFKGIVTNVLFTNSLENAGDIVFSGYSPTILLDNGEGNSSHLERSLNQVVQEISGNVPGNALSVKANPVKKSTIPYITQYRESNFQFIRRLAAEYGEYFYYDGAALNFGKPSKVPEVSLNYPFEISKLDLQVKVAPVGFERVGYLSKEDKKTTSKSSSAQVAGLDNLGKFALSESDKVFDKNPSALSTRKFLTASELDEDVKINKSNRAAELTVVVATSDSPSIGLGTSVQIKANKTDLGKFTITAISHSSDGFGNYSNEFEGVPSSVAVVASPYNQKPIAEPQIAVVKNMADPDNLGKVKVQMLWQKDSDTTPFIRVLSPNGGTYGDGKKTRGVFFTPEVGDYVIVGFTQNDPDRPFVMGALSTGKAISSAASTNKNQVKSISTRSGNIISFFDKDSENEIRIQTDDTNYISINLKGSDGTIKVYSSKAIEVNSKETIVVKSGKTIDVQAAENITVQGDKKVTIKSQDIAMEAQNSISLKANQKISINGLDVAIEASNGLNAKANASAKVEALQLELSGSVGAKVKGGAQLELSGGAMASLKGAIVQIN